MLRSVRIAAVVVGLAWTGLARAQSSSPLEKARYINVSEEGKPPQRCKLLKTWRDSNGVPTFQVQAVDTGEIMTIVATAPRGAAGDPREMTTRIFRWGKDNRPPAGSPVPPPITVATPLPTRPTVVQKPPTIAPQPVRPSPVVVKPQPIQTAPIAQKPVSSPAAAPAKPAFTASYLTSTKSESPILVTKTKPDAANKPQLTPMGTQVVQYKTASTEKGQLPPVPTTTDSQPRLAPTASGNVANQTPCNCACPQPCASCGKACDSCCQSSCVSCTSSPVRQPLIRRIFKSNTSCDCATIVTQSPPKPEEKPAAATPPAPIVVQTATEPAKPSDWRQSWGKVEPWKGSAQTTTVKPIEVSKRMDPEPVRMDPSQQPDPLKAPDQYRDMAINSRLTNSKIPQPVQTVEAQPKKGLLRGWTIGKPPAPRVEEPMPPDRTIVIAADEPNAFWKPEKPAAPKEQVKINAFDRQPEAPPQGVPPTIAGVPPHIPITPPIIPGIMQGPPPQGIVLKNAPCPPMAPYTAPPGPPRPMSPDTGVAESMGNAFTLSATHRPIPADFGGTPQEPNGFDPMVRQGDGSPPRGYGMPMQATGRPQMPNMMAMGPQAQMAVNPLMYVPATPPYGQYAASAGAYARPGGVPQLLTSLKNSLCPSEREAAAEQLSELNWRIQPMVVECLMKSAREDPAASVRAACVHALAHMKVNTPAALALVRDLKTDHDATVRQEAEEALNVLGGSGIQQASHK